MPYIERKTILENMRSQLAQGRALLGAGAGIGLSAKCAEAGGADLIIIYNSGRFRMAGRCSMSGMFAYGDANAILLDMVEEILPMVKHVPVLAGVCATDPFRHIPSFLKQLRELGFSGVQNFPSIGTMTAYMDNLEAGGLGYSREVEMIRIANEMDLFTASYCFNDKQIEDMTRAGADIVIPHMRLTTNGYAGASVARKLDDCIESIQRMADLARSIRPDVLVLCHGGPIATPEDVQYVLDHTQGVDGFFGASSIERIPVEIAVTDMVRSLKAVTLGGDEA